MMRKGLKERLEAAGWAVGEPRELLGLTDAEDALVDAKLHLAEAVRALRTRRGWSQSDLAELMGSSQPRVAKIENKDREVSLELQMRAIFAARPESRREFAGLVMRWSGGGGKEPTRSERASEFIEGETVQYRQGRGVFAATVVEINAKSGVVTLERMSDLKKVVRPAAKVVRG
jgi:transcriptional regulator with XRE-family HTH domain